MLGPLFAPYGIEHLAKYVEEFIISSERENPGSVSLVLLFPVNFPEVEKWIPVLKRFPQFLEIRLRVTECRSHKSYIASNRRYRE